MTRNRLCQALLLHARLWIFLPILLVGCHERVQDEVLPDTSPSGHPALSLHLASDESMHSTERPEAPPEFLDVAGQLGVDFVFFNDEVSQRFFLPEVMGGGAGWLDFDLDGWLDLYLVNGAKLDPSESSEVEHVNRLFRNQEGGNFTEVTFVSQAADGKFGQGCAVGDFDADGFADLYICNYGANVLLHNNGDGTFRDVTEASGVGDPLWSTSAVWCDLNADDLLDIYVVNYLDVTLANTQPCEYNGKPGYCGPGSYESVPDRAFVNDGRGGFVESAEKLGLTAPGGKGLAVAVADLDNDLQPEIYVANDMMENFLFARSKTARQHEFPQYENVAVASGCAVASDGNHEASMGIACADFDNDGGLDIFLTHYFANKNTLYRNLGNLLFQDDSRRTRLAATSFDKLGFGTVALDYDQDGASDLFVANGHVLGPLHDPHKMRSQLLHNDGTGKFSDISHLAGPYFQEMVLGRGAAGADYDHDGDTDLVVTHLHRKAALLRNDTQTHRHFLGLRLKTRSRVPPWGAQVVVKAGERQVVASIVGGGSYLSSGDPRILLGLGDWESPVDVTVHWPSGQIDTFAQVKADQYWRICESRATVVPALP